VYEHPEGHYIHVWTNKKNQKAPYYVKYNSGSTGPFSSARSKDYVSTIKAFKRIHTRVSNDPEHRKSEHGGYTYHPVINKK
jgi:hypothetical protein